MKIIWSELAIRNYRENLDYLVNNWNYNVLSNFIDEVDSCILKISKNPSIGKYDDLINCNKLLIIKQIYLFYEVINGTLYILNIWNNKRKPYWNN